MSRLERPVKIGKNPMENMLAPAYVGKQDQANRREPSLVLLAQDGSLDAFNQLVLMYQDRIFNLAVRLTGDEDTADDIAQNTFLTAYRNLPRFRNGSFKSWIYRIATNLCYDEHRRYKRNPVQSIDQDDLAEERLSPLYDFSGSSVSPEREVEKHELQHFIQDALNQLEADHRSVIVLVDQMELDYQEAAGILDVPVGTVKSRLARARARLKKLLTDTGGLQRYL